MKQCPRHLFRDDDCPEPIERVLEERGKMYNTGNAMDPETNFECACRLAEVYEMYVAVVNKIEHKAHRHAMRMVLMKIARIATGTSNKENYDDAIGYLTLARGITLDKRNISSNKEAVWDRNLGTQDCEFCQDVRKSLRPYGLRLDGHIDYIQQLHQREGKEAETPPGTYGQTVTENKP